jgi:hypothetical protein
VWLCSSADLVIHTKFFVRQFIFNTIVLRNVFVRTMVQEAGRFELIVIGPLTWPGRYTRTRDSD